MGDSDLTPNYNVLRVTHDEHCQRFTIHLNHGFDKVKLLAIVPSAKNQVRSHLSIITVNDLTYEELVALSWVQGVKHIYPAGATQRLRLY